VGFQCQRGARLLSRHGSGKNDLVLGMHISVEAWCGAKPDRDMAVALAVAVEDVQQVARPSCG